MQMLLIASLLFTGADAEPDTLPKGQPPQLTVLSVKGLTIRQVVYRQVPVAYTVIEKRIVGGKVEEVTVTKMAMQMVAEEREYTVKDVKATTAGGKKLDADALTKAMTTPRVVLISSDGKAVDPAYLKLYKPETPVLILPRAGVPPRDVAPMPPK